MAIVGWAGFAGASPVRAAGPQVVSETITVDNNTDDINGTCAVVTKCTVRAAVEKINADNPTTGEIDLPTGTFTLTKTAPGGTTTTTGSLQITNGTTVKIKGAGSGSSIITGNPEGWTDRILDIASGPPPTEVDVTGVTLEHGDVSNNCGGTDNNGGIIRNPSATLRLADVVVRDGNAGNGAGGGIYNNGTLTLDSASVVGPNDLAIEGGGIASGPIILEGCLAKSAKVAQPNIVVAASVTLDGATVTNDEAGQAGGGIYVLLSSLTLQNGASVVVNDVSQDFSEGGGIFTADATVTIHNSLIDHNTSFGSGGGVYFEFSTVTFDTSTVSNNVANVNGGGIYNTANCGNQTFSRLLIKNNTAHGQMIALANGGGGIYDQVAGQGQATFSDLQVTGNKAGGLPLVMGGLPLVDARNQANAAVGALANGGGVYENMGALLFTGVQGSAQPRVPCIEAAHVGTVASVSYQNVTIDNNTASQWGGGVYVHNTSAVVPFTNATIVANTATVAGGGLAMGASVPGLVTLQSNTVAQNSSGGNGGGIALLDRLDNVSFGNTIVFGNSATGTGPNCSAAAGTTLTSTGGNLSNDTAATDCHLTGTGDLLNKDPLLGTLADNSAGTSQPSIGATGASPNHAQTEALADPCPPGVVSPAVDTAITAAAPATDERHVTRPQGPNSDIGAFEAFPPTNCVSGNPGGLNTAPNSGAGGSPALGMLLLGGGLLILGCLALSGRRRSTRLV
jgi:hypothetical protein